MILYYSLAQDVNTICEEDGSYTPRVGAYILFSIITCGIYHYYWRYKLGFRLAFYAPSYQLHFAENGTSILTWSILGTCLGGSLMYSSIYALIYGLIYLSWVGTILGLVGQFMGFSILIKNTNRLADDYNKRIWICSINRDKQGEAYMAKAWLL